MQPTRILPLACGALALGLAWCPREALAQPASSLTQRSPSLSAAELARAMLRVMGELRIRRFAVVPADVPLGGSGPPLCDAAWRFAFDVQGELVRHAGGQTPDTWETWAIAAAARVARGESTDDAFLTEVRQGFGADYVIVLTHRTDDGAPLVQVNEYDRDGQEVRDLPFPLTRPFALAQVSLDTDRCAPDTPGSRTMLITSTIGREIHQLIDEERLGPGALPRIALWVDPNIIAPGGDRCDRSRLLHALLQRRIWPEGGAAFGPDEVRLAATDAAAPGTSVLRNLPSATGVVTVRRRGEDERHVTVEVEYIVNGRVAGQPRSHPIRRDNWTAMVQSLQCPAEGSGHDVIIADTVPVTGASQPRRQWFLLGSGYVGGALNTAAGEDGKVAGGGVLRFGVALSRDDPGFHLGASVAFGSDRIGLAQAVLSYRLASVHLGIGAGAAVSASEDFRVDDAVAGASITILAPFSPGASAGWSLGAEIEKGFATPLAYAAFSLGIWGGFVR